MSSRKPVWRFLIGAAALALAAHPGELWAADPARDARWREDLQFLASELPRRHPNLFFQIQREDFDRAVSDLNQRVPDLVDAEVIVGMMRIVALPGDEHTSIFPLPFRALPIALRWFDDGLFVTAAATENRRAVGARVVQIGDLEVPRAYDLVSTVVSHENDAWVRQQSAAFLTMAEILYSLRIAPRPDTVRYTVEDAAGARFVIDVAPGQTGAVQAPDPGTGFIPLWRRNVSRFYWFEYLPGAKAIYVAYNVCSNMPDLSFRDFVNQLGALAQVNPVDRLIIDVRNNAGGDNSVIQPLLSAIRASGGGSGGRVTVIIGRHTASSGMSNAITLADDYGSTLVGEATGGKPNAYGNILTFKLPNSGLTVQYSTRFFQFRPQVDTVSLLPDVAVGSSSADYFARLDPFLTAALVLPGRPASVQPPDGSAITANAASFRSPVTPGSLASVFGNFTGLAAGDAIAIPLPRQINGAQVFVNGVAAPLLAVRPAQINFQVPAGTPPGRATVRVTAGATKLASGNFDVGDAPGIFVLNAVSLDKPGAVLNQDERINSETARARRGEVISIYATGSGAVSPAVEDGAPPPADLLARTVVQPRIFFGTEEGDVLFSGLSPQFPGLWQINVRVPTAASVTRQMPLVVIMNGRASNAVTIWVE